MIESLKINQSKYKHEAEDLLKELSANSDGYRIQADKYKKTV